MRRVARGAPVAIALGMIALAPSARAGAAPAAPDLPRPRAFSGVSVVNAQNVRLPEGESRAFASALEVVFVAPGSPGEAAAIETGDVVLALDGASFDPADGDPAVRWRSLISERAPLSAVTLTVLRRGVTTMATRDGQAVADAAALLADLPAALEALEAGGRLAVDIRREPRIEDIEIRLARHPLDADETLDAAAFARADLAPHGVIAEAIVARHGTSEALADLRARLRSVALSSGAARLPVVRTTLASPWHLPAIARELATALAPQGAAGEPGALAHRAAGLLPLASPPAAGFTARRLAPPSSVDEILAQIETALADATRAREQALRDVSEAERAFVVEHAAGLPAALAELIYLHADENRARAAANRRLLDIASRVDVAGLLRAAEGLASLADPAWLGAVGRVLRAAPNASDPIIARRATAAGEIVLAGTGANVHRDIEPAVLVDAGGDDLHANRAGGAAGDARPIGIVIDLAGNDAYEATDTFVQGSGVLGIGMVIDVAGDDTYLGKDGAQGVGLCGVGLLIDRGGDDRFRALHFAQGVGFFGLGAVMDDAGDDDYAALSQAQGLGLPHGAGVLHDRAGDDRYFAKGGVKTGYGTQGVFDAWSQGCGLGLRYLASGGIGLLADDAGADAYEAGNFAQGGGYYFGFGMLRDAGRDADRFIASRYGQGWSAHQAVGAFLDEGGDDLYETRHGVIAGLAWDQSVSWFADEAGNDTYRGSFFSLGASAHNSIMMFEDLGGSDRYEGVAVARAGGNDYHGGTSVSLFLDLGRGRDVYEQEPPGALASNGEHGFALDLPGGMARWSDASVLTRHLDVLLARTIHEADASDGRSRPIAASDSVGNPRRRARLRLRFPPSPSLPSATITSSDPVRR